MKTKIFAMYHGKVVKKRTLVLRVLLTLLCLLGTASGLYAFAIFYFGNALSLELSYNLSVIYYTCIIGLNLYYFVKFLKESFAIVHCMRVSRQFQKICSLLDFDLISFLKRRGEETHDS